MKLIKDALVILAVGLAFAAVIGGGCWFYVARWNECRRVHPLWYCATDGGR